MMNIWEKYSKWKLIYINSDDNLKKEMLIKFKNNYNLLIDSDKIKFKFIFYYNFNKNNIPLYLLRKTNNYKCDIKIKYIIFPNIYNRIKNLKIKNIKIRLEKEKKLLGIQEFNKKRRALFKKRYYNLTPEKKQKINIRKKYKYNIMNPEQKKIFLLKQKELFNIRIINELKKELNTEIINDIDIKKKKKEFWNNEYNKKLIKNDLKIY